MASGHEIVAIINKNIGYNIALKNKYFCYIWPKLHSSQFKEKVSEVFHVSQAIITLIYNVGLSKIFHNN